MTVAAGFPYRKRPKFPVGKIPIGQFGCILNFFFLKCLGYVLMHITEISTGTLIDTLLILGNMKLTQVREMYQKLTGE